MFWLAGYKSTSTDGNYDVKFKFAENYFDAQMQEFCVYLEHNKVVSNLDIIIWWKKSALVKEIKIFRLMMEI